MVYEGAKDHSSGIKRPALCKTKMHRAAFELAKHLRLLSRERCFMCLSPHRKTKEEGKPAGKAHFAYNDIKLHKFLLKSKISNSNILNIFILQPHLKNILAASCASLYTSIWNSDCIQLGSPVLKTQNGPTVIPIERLNP